MSRTRSEVYFEKRRNMWVGRFWRLKKPGQRPPTKDLLPNRPDIDQLEIDLAFRRTEKELLEEMFGENSNINPISFSGASTEWLSSIKGIVSPNSYLEYERAIRHWLRLIGDHSISLINAKANAKFVELRRKEGVSDSTIQKDQRHLNIFTTYLHHEGHTAKKIYTKKLKVEEKEVDIPSEDELFQVEKIVSGNINWLRTYMLARYAVMRAGEIWALPLDHISLRKKEIKIAEVPELGWKVKTREMRKIPINKDVLYPFLAKDLETRSPAERWYLDKGNGYPAYWSSWALTQIFRRICSKTGIKGPKPLHGIRAFGITKMLLDSGRPELVAQVAGHSEAVMFKHYARITSDNSRSVVDLL